MTLTTILMGLVMMISLNDESDRIAGLMVLPEVLGDGPCVRFEPEEIPLYATPESAEAVGVIRADRRWRVHEGGGCDPLQVNVHRADGGSPGAMPTLEYDYVAPAAIVLEQRGEWFRLHLPGGSAWMRITEQAEYLPLEDLVAKRMAYFTRAVEGNIHAEPGVPEREVEGDRYVASAHEPVRVTASRELDGQLWLRVDVLSHSTCESIETPELVAQGWLPAHAPSGKPTVWFHSRGC